MEEQNDNSQPEENVDAPIEETWEEDWQKASEKAAEKAAEKAGETTEEPEPEEQTEETSEPEAEPEESSEEEPEEQPEESEPEEPADPEEEHAKFEELAEKLGYSLDNNKVETKERVNFRRQYRAKVNELQAKMQAADAKYDQVIKQVRDQYEPFVKMKEAADRGDLDAVATNLGYNNFAELTIAHANGNTPENAKMRQMQQQMRQMQQQQESAARAQQLQQAQMAYQSQVSQTLAQYSDTADYAQDPAFAKGVIDVQRNSIDPTTGRTTLSIEQAATLILDHLPGGRANVAQKGSQSPNSEDVTDASRNKTVETGRKKPPKTVTRKSTAEASSTNLTAREDETEEQFFTRWIAKM